MKKEIDKEIVKFDLKRLKGTKVVVNCVTEEQFQSFINWVNSLGIDLDNDNPWEEYQEDSCLRLDLDLTWWYYDIEGSEKEGYKVISYEEALLKESNKEEPKETTEETSKQTNTQVNKQPKIKDEFISKIKTEKIGIRINSEEELSIWFDFLDKHSDKGLNRLKPPCEKGYIYSNNSAFGNIMEFNTDDGYYIEDKGFTIYNFKDICEDFEEDTDVDNKPTKLSDFLKKNNCYEKFINNFDKEFYYSDWKREISDIITIAFAWKNTEDGYAYWRYIDDKWGEIVNKENDLIDFFEDKGQETGPIEPLKYLVQVKGKGVAKVKHSYESAIKEAQRLCKKEAPTEVYVLEIKKTFKSEVIVLGIIKDNKTKEIKW